MVVCGRNKCTTSYLVFHDIFKAIEATEAGESIKKPIQVRAGYLSLFFRHPSYFLALMTSLNSIFLYVIWLSI
jgi:hypothetical protein